MQTVRYFSRLIDPALYRRGFGFFGWCLWLLNFVRVWLERRIVIGILSVELSKEGVPRKERKRVLAEAKADPSFSPFNPPVEKHPIIQRLIRELPQRFESLDERTAARYTEGRINAPERPVELTEGPFAEFFARHKQDEIREFRYKAGRRKAVVYEDFEEVKKEEGHIG